MKLPKFSGKPRKPKQKPGRASWPRRRFLLLRQVTGESMRPALRQGTIVLAHGLWRQLRPGDVVVLRHGSLDKIKRIQAIQNAQVYLVGDNLPQSTDSRTLGWLDVRLVIGKVVWPRVPARQ